MPGSWRLFKRTRPLQSMTTTRRGRLRWNLRANVGNAQRQAAREQQCADEGEAGGDEALKLESEGELNSWPGQAECEHHGQRAETEGEHERLAATHSAKNRPARLTRY